MQSPSTWSPLASLLKGQRYPTGITSSFQSPRNVAQTPTTDSSTKTRWLSTIVPLYLSYIFPDETIELSLTDYVRRS